MGTRNRGINRRSCLVPEAEKQATEAVGRQQMKRKRKGTKTRLEGSVL